MHIHKNGINEETKYNNPNGDERMEKREVMKNSHT
jgi:hypothetical protein